MDLKIWTTLSFGLMLLAGPALAQDDPPLAQGDSPLTTLLLPHRLSAPAPLGRTDPLSGSGQLFGDDPLASVDALTGEGSLSNPRPARRQAGGAAKPGQDAADCARRAAAERRRARSSVADGGSGPGEYARFLDNGQQADATTPAPRSSTSQASPATAAAATSSGLPADRPLYGGVDRPLWSEPHPRAERRSQTTEQRTADPSASSAPPSDVDRPLWAEPGSTNWAAAPCDGEAGTHRVAVPPSTLFFGTGPAR